MTQKTKNTHNRILIGMALGIITMSALADEYFWTIEGNGSYSNEESWNDGMSGYPGVEDVAIFDLDASYEVRISEPDGLDITYSDRVCIRDGNITFRMPPDGSIRLLNPLSSSASIIIAEEDGDTADLNIGFALELWGQFMIIGQGPNTNGSVTLSSHRHVFKLDATLDIGQQGNGMLDASAGSHITSGSGVLGHSFTGFGEAFIAGVGDSGASRWDCNDALIVGQGGDGFLTITEGADVISGGAIIGKRDLATGSVIVSGPGSSWIVNGSLDIGMNGIGTMLIEDGGSVFNTDFAILGTYPGWPPEEGDAVGDVTVVGLNSFWWVQGDLHVGWGGDGTLTLANGGTVRVEGHLIGALDDEGSLLEIELGSRFDYVTPAIFVAGTADAFDVHVTLVEGFVPNLGDWFVILHAAGGAGTMDCTLPELPALLDWDVTQDGHEVILTIVEAPLCPEDLVLPAGVEQQDLNAILNRWGDPDCETGGAQYPCPEDLASPDGIEQQDLNAVLNRWGDPICESRGLYGKGDAVSMK